MGEIKKITENKKSIENRAYKNLKSINGNGNVSLIDVI